MIHCNLSILLAERNLKITRVSADTGISRTTLTSLAGNKSQGIQFDTLNTLCMYLGVPLERLVSFFPYDFDFEVAKYESLRHDYSVKLEVIVYDGRKRITGTFDCAVTLHHLEDDVTLIDGIDIDVKKPLTIDEETKTDTLFVYKIINELPVGIQLDLGAPLIDKTLEALSLEGGRYMSFGVTWFEEGPLLFSRPVE